MTSYFKKSRKIVRNGPRIGPFGKKNIGNCSWRRPGNFGDVKLEIGGELRGQKCRQRSSFESIFIFGGDG